MTTGLVFKAPQRNKQHHKMPDRNDELQNMRGTHTTSCASVQRVCPPTIPLAVTQREREKERKKGKAIGLLAAVLADDLLLLSHSPVVFHRA